MIGWVILGIVLLVLAAALLSPVRARVSWDGDALTAQVCYGPLKLQLFPRPAGKKEEKGAEPEEEKKKKTAPKPTAKINREQIFYCLEKLPPVLGKALRRVGRRVTVSPLKIYLLIAGPDPADTAQLYGMLTLFFANSLPVLQRTVRVREQDIRLFPDFAEEQMRCIASVGVSIRPWDVLVIGACAGVSLVRWFLGFRKLSSPPPAADEDESSGTDNQDTVKGEAA